jgi:hypothetical protein
VCNAADSSARLITSNRRKLFLCLVKRDKRNYRYVGEGLWLHAFVISLLAGGERPASRPGCITPEKTVPETH